MRAARGLTVATVFGAVLWAAVAAGDDMNTIEDFADGRAEGWSFISDQVMGGVSTGSVTLAHEDGRSFLRLTGQVSTANRGGFIQARLRLDQPLPDDARGIEMEVRGNGQTYYMHLRGRGMSLPWQFHQARFETTTEWRVVWLPFDGFEPRGALFDRPITAASVRSIAVVAYGRDHEAEVEVRRIGWY